MIVQLDVAFFFGVKADFFSHEDLVIWSEQTWNFILVDQIVHVLEHETVLELIVCE